MVIAEEIGKLSQADSKSVSGISQYKRDAAMPRKKSRKKKCTAFKEKCVKCSGVGHFERQCHFIKPRKPQPEKRQLEQAAEVTTDTAR